MCGFIGFIDPKRNRDASELRAIADHMSSRIAHRGPDDQGNWVSVDHQMALGFRRLSIIDVSEAGHQPITSRDGKFSMVFNGEIYNYLELKKALHDSGCPIETDSDSVVLFHALCYWGIDKTLAFIRGMFAIAFWNANEKKLFLIRDRLGQKPLYYFHCGNTIVFGSELKALVAYPGFKKSLRHEAVAGFLKYAYVPDPMAIYEDTYKVSAAQYLIYTADSGELQSRTYWHLETVTQAQIDTRSEAELKAWMHGILRESVALRMRSDVPFGSFLSGGIDSSLVTALMQSQSREKIKTFSIGFHEAQYNESPYAKKIADHLGTDHTEWYLSPKEAQAAISLLPQIYDEPFADASQIPTYLLSQLTRQHVTVALSGDGGDESFAGYNRHVWVPKMWKFIGKQATPMKVMAKFLIRTLTPQQWNYCSRLLLMHFPTRLKHQNIGDKLYKLLPFFESISAIDVYERLSSFWQDPNHILNQSAPSNFYDQTCLNQDLIAEMMYRDTKYYLPGDILTKVDRASMAVGLEVRSPFLDHRVVESAWQLPFSMKLQGAQGKIILKNLLAEYVPRTLFERPKMGFGVPISDWLRGPLKDWASDLLSEAALQATGIFNVNEVKKHWEAHLSGSRNWEYPLWSILMFQTWKIENNV